MNNHVLVTNSTEANIPSLIVFPAFAEVVERATDVLAKATVIFTIAEFVLNSYLGYSLSFLWTFMNMLQLIVFLPLVNVEFPRNALDFNKAFVMIANFDMLPTQDFYGSVLSFGSQTAFSPNFEELGMETHNLIFNMGFVFLYFPFFVMFLTVLLMAWTCKYFNSANEQVEDRVEPYSTRPKTRSSRCFNWLRDFMFWNRAIRFFLEGYIDFAVVSLVQFYDMKSKQESTDGTWFYFGDWIASVLAIVLAVMVFAAPFVLHRFISQNKEHFLNSRAFNRKYGVIVEETNYRNDQSSMRHMEAFLIRRLIFTLIVVFLIKMPFFQIQGLLYT